METKPFNESSYQRPPVAMGVRNHPPTDYICNSLVSGDDRGCVLIGESMIAYALENLLKLYFSNCHRDADGNVPEWVPKLVRDLLHGAGDKPALLSSTWAKAQLALGLGLLSSDQVSICTKIRHLRLTCAHHPGEVVLSADSMKPLLKLHSQTAHAGDIEWSENEAVAGRFYSWGIRHKNGELSLERRQFMHICVALYGDIVLKTQRINPDPNGARGLLIGVGEHAGLFVLPDEAGDGSQPAE